MAHKSFNDLKEEFRKDYSSAISYYNEQDLRHFNRDIRVAIEWFSQLLICDIVGETSFNLLQDNIKYIDSYGNLQNQNPPYVISGSGWIKNAKHAFQRVPHFGDITQQRKNVRQKIESGLEVLNSQYSEVSETSQHGGEIEDIERMRTQSTYCVSAFAALFQSISEYISIDLNDFFNRLPIPQDLKTYELSVAASVLEKDNAMYQLDEIAQGFRNTGSLKFVAILPQNASKILGANRLSDFYKIKWSLVIDFNTDDTSPSTLFSSAPASMKHIVSGETSSVTDGAELINWMFAKGRNSLDTYSGTELMRKFPANFKNIFGQMVKAGSTSDYVIVSFCDNLDSRVLTKAFDKLEDIFGDWDSAEKRCKFVCISNDSQANESISKWGEDIGIKPFSIEASINDFINHICWTSPDSTVESQTTHNLIRGKSLDISNDICRYRAAGIEFFGPSMVNNAPNSIWDFYSGAEISWNELENDCDAKRDTYTKIKHRILELIKTNRTNVRSFTLRHRPGSGGTTLSRRLAYDIYKEDEANLISCTVVEIRSCKNISDTYEYMSKLSEDTDNACVLAIVESKNVGRNVFDRLMMSLAKAKKNIVLFYLETLSGRFKSVNQTDVAFLDDVLNGDEGKFTLKYKSQGLDESIIVKTKQERNNKSLEVIDFPLLLKEDMSSDSLQSYVSGWMEALPDNLREFVGFVGFVGYYSQSGLNQNLVRETWLDTSNNHYTLKGYDTSIMSAIYKLLIEEYYSEEPLGIWRARYNKFSKYLIQAAWGENWRVRLSEISKKFIQHCSKSGILGEDDKDMLYSLFIIRKDIDFRAEEVGRKNKFSSLINDLDDPERAASIFNMLTETYPDDAIFHGHYARFLYEKASAKNNNASADDKLFLDAQEQLDIAFDINPYDSDLYHMQGMLIRRQMSALLKEFERTEEKNDDYINEVDSTVEDWVKQALESFEKSIEYDPSSPYGYAASCQLLREAIEFGKKLSDCPDYSFCEKDYRYTEYIDLLGEKLDQFEQVCYSFKENALAQITPSLNIYNDVRLFHRDLIGCTEQAIAKFRDYYANASGEMRSMYGDLLVKSILYSKSNTKDFKTAYSVLRENERKEIEQILQRKRDEGDLKCYDSLFKLYRYGKNAYPIDSAIDLLKDCESSYEANGQKGWGYLNACFYLAVCYSALAMKSGEKSSELVSNAEKYFAKATELAHVFEKSTINSLCYYGERPDIHCIVDRDADGVVVSGVIIRIENGKGIMRMKCGLEASFNAKGMDKFKYQGKPIQGIIGFKYSGLGLYQFGGFDDPVSSEEEIEEIINNSYIPDFTSDEDKTPDIINEQTGIKVLGKIELPETKKTERRIASDKTYIGIYQKNNDSVVIPGRNYTYKVRSKSETDLYDGADVEFELGSEPNSKNPEKLYYYAKNVRLK